MKKGVVTLLITSIFALSGCLGTFITRTGGSFVGAYPYQAVALDVSLVGDSGGTGIKLANIFIFIPFDLILDTAFLPFDLIGWPFGYKKEELRLYPSP